jgi:K+-transporting ATPase ATPase C chain
MKELKTAFLLFALLTLLLGGIYPAVVTVTARILFSDQAGGSLITDRSGRLIGSSLIGQDFSGEKYFWPRPSATGSYPYNPLLSAGSNLAPTHPELIREVGERIHRLRQTGVDGVLPADLVSSSASGLDPHISPESARLQIARVAKGRGLSNEQVEKLVAGSIEGRQLGVLGMPRVNVVALNLALDKASP